MRKDRGMKNSKRKGTEPESPAPDEVKITALHSGLLAPVVLVISLAALAIQAIDVILRIDILYAQHRILVIIMLWTLACICVWRKNARTISFLGLRSLNVRV